MEFKFDDQTWSELSRLLDEVLDLPHSERQTWLSAMAANYQDQQPRLWNILTRAAQVETQDFLNAPPKIGAPKDADGVNRSAQTGNAGESIGPYRLVRELGSGGMGAVWLAERTDGLVNRLVALKLPHRSFIARHAELAERMAREREILATLNHPNIATMYDAGIDSQGQPYLALEYVEGEPIDRYCDSRALSVGERLKLFTQVANAVAHAHAKLIVHRDLKPSNILVTAMDGGNGRNAGAISSQTEDGQVRLLDFGIAKLLDDGVNPSNLTEVSARALTPDYASPEQITGEPISTASDIYSLGVILYELLAGARPYNLKRDSRGALEDAILQMDPQKPSDVADATKRRLLRGDLDTIVLKALKKRPDERYATANALVDDIFRYLDRRPVLAQRDSGWYRLRKFALRQRLVLAASLFVLAAIIGGAGISMWQARVAIQERQRADEVKEFIASVFREADPTQGTGKVLSAVELLRQAERRLQDRGDADPRMRLELLAILGESLFGLQENADSARVIEQALRLQTSAGVADDLLNARLHLALSQSYEYLGRNDDALAELKRSFALLTASTHAESQLFVRAKLHEAAMGQAVADYVLAERAAKEAIDAASRIVGPRSSEVATGLQLLSQSYTFVQQRELAVETARSAYDIMLELHNRDSGHPKVMDSAMYYGRALQFAGNFDAAYEYIRNATTRTATLFGSDSRMVGELLSACVLLEIERGDLKLAVANARRSLAIYLEQQESGSMVHSGQMRLLGQALVVSRAASEAAEKLEEALRLSLAANNAPGVIHSRTNFGLALAYLGRFDQAESQQRIVLEAAGPLNIRARHLAMRNLGTALRLQGRYAESLLWFDQALAAAAVHLNHRGDLAHGLVESGLSKLELGDAAAAQALFLRAKALLDDVQGQRTTPARADLFVGMARVQMLGGNHKEALPLLEKAADFWRDFDPENRWAGEAAFWLGRCYLALGRNADARSALSRAEKILVRSPLPSDVKLLTLARAR